MRARLYNYIYLLIYWAQAPPGIGAHSASGDRDRAFAPEDLGFFQYQLLALIPGCLFPCIVPYVCQLWLQFDLHFGLVFCKIVRFFSDFICACIFRRFSSIQGTQHIRKSWFYCSKTMISIKPVKTMTL
jgi:hypothetical protein